MRKLWLIFAQTVTVGLALLFVIITLRPQWVPAPPWQHRPPGMGVLAPSTATNPTLRGPGVPAAAVGFSEAAKRAAR